MNIYLDKLRSNSNQGKYVTWYEKIIINGLNRSANLKDAKLKLGYVERHHILPVSICSNENEIGDKSNLVFLTAREHFVCHLILTKCFSNINYIQKMNRALSMFLRDRHGHRILNSYEFESARKACAAAQSFDQKGKKRTRESIEKAISTCIEKYGGGSSRYNQKISEEQKDKMRKTRSTRPNYNTWFKNKDPEIIKKNHSDWAKKYSTFATNNPSSTPEGARNISLKKSKGIFKTPYGEFLCRYDMMRHEILSKIDLINCRIFDKLDSTINTRAINRALLPKEWKGLTWRQVGFDFVKFN